MKPTHHFKPVIVLSCIAVITVTSIFMWSKKTNAKPSILSAEAGSQIIWNSLSSNYDLNSKRDLIDSFCKAVATQADGFIDQAHNLSYSPRQSIFVDALCTSL